MSSSAKQCHSLARARGGARARGASARAGGTRPSAAFTGGGEATVAGAGRQHLAAGPSAVVARGRTSQLFCSHAMSIAGEPRDLSEFYEGAILAPFVRR
jgi:hypothetical protein